MRPEWQGAVRICKTRSFFKEPRRGVFNPAGLALALARPVHVAQVFTGGFRMREELLDDLVFTLACNARKRVVRALKSKCWTTDIVYEGVGYPIYEHYTKD